MSEQEPKTLSAMEEEAALSYREWPVYIIMRLKRLQEIQRKLRVAGERDSQLFRKEELLKAVYDNVELSEAEAEALVRGDAPDNFSSADTKPYSFDNQPIEPFEPLSDDDYYDVSFEDEE